MTTFNTELHYCISVGELLLSWVWFEMSRKMSAWRNVSESESLWTYPLALTGLFFAFSFTMSQNLPVIDHKTADHDMRRPVGSLHTHLNVISHTFIQLFIEHHQHDGAIWSHDSLSSCPINTRISHVWQGFIFPQCSARKMLDYKWWTITNSIFSFCSVPASLPLPIKALSSVGSRMCPFD